MMEQKEPYYKVIVALSIVIPLAVAVLFRVDIPGYDFSFLPPIYAALNGVTAVLLMISYWAIRNGRRKTHKRINLVCVAFSAAFLVMYILYHMTSEETRYGGEGIMRSIYYFILVTHISLSAVIVPLILFTLSRALAGNFERHKRLAKFTFPVWLYVAISGVVVYLMISPYYK